VKKKQNDINNSLKLKLSFPKKSSFIVRIIGIKNSLVKVYFFICIYFS